MTAAPLERHSRLPEPVLEMGRLRLRSWITVAEEDARRLLGEACELEEAIDEVLGAFRMQGRLDWGHLDALVLPEPAGQEPQATLTFKDLGPGLPTAIRWPGSEPGKEPEQVAYELLVFAAIKIHSDAASDRRACVFDYGGLSIEVPSGMVDAARAIARDDVLAGPSRERMLQGTAREVLSRLGRTHPLPAWVAMAPGEREALHVRLSVLLALGVDRIDPADGQAGRP